MIKNSDNLNSLKSKLGIYISLPKSSLDRNLFINLIFRELNDLLLKADELMPYSLFLSGDIANILIVLRRFSLEIKQFSEVTVELSDAFCELERFLKAGVSRVSIKVDSFEDEVRNCLNKRNSSAEIIDMIMLYRSQFELSIDLIHMPFLDPQHLEKSLDIFLALNLNHVSIYSLIDDFKIRNKFKELLKADSIEQNDYLQELIQYKLVEFNRYQASNFAKPGFESKQAMIYGEYGNWIGVGPGGCSRISIKKRRIAIDNYKNIALWAKKCLQDSLGSKKVKFLNKKSIKREEFIMKLLSNRFIEASSPLLDRVEAVKELLEMGFLEGTPDRFRLTMDGFYKYDEVALRLLDLI